MNKSKIKHYGYGLPEVILALGVIAFILLCGTGIYYRGIAYGRTHPIVPAVAGEQGKGDISTASVELDGLLLTCVFTHTKTATNVSYLYMTNVYCLVDGGTSYVSFKDYEPVVPVPKRYWFDKNVRVAVVAVQQMTEFRFAYNTTNWVTAYFTNSTTESTKLQSLRNDWIDLPYEQQ